MREQDYEYYFERYTCVPNCDEGTGSFPIFILGSRLINTNDWF